MAEFHIPSLNEFAAEALCDEMRFVSASVDMPCTFIRTYSCQMCAENIGGSVELLGGSLSRRGLDYRIGPRRQDDNGQSSCRSSGLVRAATGPFGRRYLALCL